MSTIRRLPAEIANKIAAGEVVERPASLAKELIENSLDAGARKIEIAFDGGGIERVRVSDDGCGIEAEEVALAFERHATSKIASASDLENVATLGFRGEALASIAAVSRVELVTATANALAGTRIRLEAGRVQDIESAARAPGTTIEVRSLFFNTPARRKFLKAPATESRLLSRLAGHLSLAAIGVGFRILREGKAVHEVSPQSSFRERVGALWGAKTASRMAEVSFENSDLRISGLVSLAEFSRTRAEHQILLVNGRSVSEASLAHAVLAGLGGAAPAGKFPIFALSLEIDPAAIDVNVHPAKREIRFARRDAVYSAIREAVLRTAGSARFHEAGRVFEMSRAKGGELRAAPIRFGLPDGVPSTASLVRERTSATAQATLRFSPAEPVAPPDPSIGELPPSGAARSGATAAPRRRALGSLSLGGRRTSTSGHRSTCCARARALRRDSRAPGAFGEDSRARFAGSAHHRLGSRSGSGGSVAFPARSGIRCARWGTGVGARRCDSGNALALGRRRFPAGVLRVSGSGPRECREARRCAREVVCLQGSREVWPAASCGRNRAALGCALAHGSAAFLPARPPTLSRAFSSHHRREIRAHMILFLPSLVGATGSGKTKLALLVAQHLELEIVNADSRQIYRGFDRGTAKPTREEQAVCPHHLLDVADPEESYSAARFGAEARRVAEEIHGRGRTPLLVGGSGLYLRAAEEGLFEGPAASPSIRGRLHERARLEGGASLHQELERVDPRSAARLSPQDVLRLVRALEVHELTGISLSEHHARHRRERTRVRAMRFGVDWEPAALARRIEERVDAMLDGGWIEEVEALLSRGVSEDAPAWNSLGYTQVRDLVRGRTTRLAARLAIVTATRQYAKRQRTWFRAVQPIRWTRVDSEAGFAALAEEIARRLREKHAP